ncbi:SNARE associated Golgi protein [Pseudomonas alcaligenes]|uniref:TVP38/TMEM64 family membrane protein n=1 Tax=Aquipseudomonas alcaligenes TaxID=43263 RepID=A0ABR7RZP5_AQUAC|nr:VTT domain-containing protein [Pseudomonas alcaligenes]MBC9249628.1 SNARE associated Golgi protein [Pseudomonas alcaligenes]
MRQYARLLLIGLFLGVLFAVFQLSGLRQHFSLEFLQHLLLAHRLGGLLLFILLFALGNLIQLPGWIFLAAAVLAFGKTWGGLATYLAACLSCLTTFGLIRWMGGNALRQLDNRLARHILSRLDAHPLGSVILLRLLFQTVPPLNYALALSGVRWRHYLLGTLLGLPLPITLYCLLFDYLGKTLQIG